MGNRTATPKGVQCHVYLGKLASAGKIYWAQVGASPNGVQGTWSTGTTTPGLGPKPLGVSSTFSTGTVTFGATTLVSIVGMEATGLVGSVSGSISAVDATVSVSGLSSSLNLGNTIQSIELEAAGSESVIDLGFPDLGVDIFPTGASVSSAVGSTNTSLDDAIDVLGVAAVGSVGNPPLTVGDEIVLSGVEALGDVGVAKPNIGLACSGVSSLAAIGDIAPEIRRTLSGVLSTGFLGTLNTTLSTLVSVLGTESVGLVGGITGSTTAQNADISIAGVEEDGSVGACIPNIAYSSYGVVSGAGLGNVSVSADCSVDVVGVECVVSVSYSPPIHVPLKYHVWATEQVEKLFVTMGAPI